MYNPIEVSQAASKAREELEKSGQVGRVETKIYTYDGNNTDIVQLENFTFAQIATGVFDLNKVVKGTALLSGNVVDFPPVTVREENGVVYVDAPYTAPGITTVPFAAYTDGKLYGLQVEGMGYLTSIEFETIHPSDPKFLPGVCLPVVEIADITNITTEESAMMDTVVAMKVPFVVKTRNGELPVSTMASEVYDGMCIIQIEGTPIALSNVDGTGWKIMG